MTTSAKTRRLLHTTGALVMVINSAILEFSQTIRAELTRSGVITSDQIDYLAITGTIIGGAILGYYLTIGVLGMDEAVERLDSKEKGKQQ